MAEQSAVAPITLEIDGKKYIFFNNALTPVPSPTPSGQTGVDNLKAGKSSKRKASQEDVDNGDDEDDDDDDDENDEGNMSKCSKPKKGKARWSEDDVVRFINILKEKHITAKLDGKCGRVPHMKIFASVAKELNEHSPQNPKTAKQCLLKYRRLRDAWNDAYEKVQISGNDSGKCEKYEELADLFRSRPRCTSREYGFDSSEPENKESVGTGEEGAIANTSEQGELGDSSQDTPKRIKTSPGTRKTFPPRYRAGLGKKNHTQVLLSQLLEKEEKESEEFRKWAAEQTQIQQDRDDKMLQGITAAITEGIASIGQVLMATQQQNVQTAPATHPAPAFATINRNGTQFFNGTQFSATAPQFVRPSTSPASNLTLRAATAPNQTRFRTVVLRTAAPDSNVNQNNS